MSEYIDLDEIERRAETRCAGKWEQYFKEIVVRGVAGTTGLLHTGSTFYDDLDCALAVKAVNATPAFIKAVRALQEIEFSRGVAGMKYCPACGRYKEHTETCVIGAALTPFSKGGPE